MTTTPRVPTRGWPTSACFAVEVDDVAASYRRAVDLGATTVVEPIDNPGGVRSDYICDLDRKLLSIYRFGPAAIASA